MGTLFPINVVHSTYVFRRIMLYTIESILGQEPFTTFVEVVRHALASHALLDAISGAKWAQEWAFSSGPNGQPPPQVEFMMSRSRGRLRSNHVFQDTEAILLEIAQDHGERVFSRLKHYFSTPSYKPESLFYVLVGAPEKIVLQPRFPGEDRLRSLGVDRGREDSQ